MYYAVFMSVIQREVGEPQPPDDLLFALSRCLVLFFVCQLVILVREGNFEWYY